MMNGADWGATAFTLDDVVKFGLLLGAQLGSLIAQPAPLITGSWARLGVPLRATNGWARRGPTIQVTEVAKLGPSTGKDGWVAGETPKLKDGWLRLRATLVVIGDWARLGSTPETLDAWPRLGTAPPVTDVWS